MAATAQQAQLPDAAQPRSQDSGSPARRGSRRSEYGKQHILWVIPNYRSLENTADIKPLTPREKFKLALEDSFDPTAFLVAGVFAGAAMAQRQFEER